MKRRSFIAGLLLGAPAAALGIAVAPVVAREIGKPPTNPDGGYLVPQKFQKQMLDWLQRDEVASIGFYQSRPPQHIKLSIVCDCDLRPELEEGMNK